MNRSINNLKCQVKPDAAVVVSLYFSPSFLFTRLVIFLDQLPHSLLIACIFSECQQIGFCFDKFTRVSLFHGQMNFFESPRTISQ